MDGNRMRDLVIAAVVSLILGIAIGYMVRGGQEDSSNNTSSVSQKTSDTAAADLRSELRSALQEHAALALPALEARAADSTQAPPLLSTLDKNSVAVAEAVEKIYPGKKDEFLSMWRKHIDYYGDYLTAAKADDDSGKSTARQNLTAFAGQLSGFFADATPQLNRSGLEADIAKHGDQTLSIIDDLVADNFDAAYTTGHEAYEHMGTIADKLAEAIVKQFPDKF